MAGLTRTLAEFVSGTANSAIPADVRHEGVRSFVNFLGCAFGGTHQEASAIAFALSDEFSGPRTATVIGRHERLDPLNATLANSIAASAQAFDDTHFATVVHPTCTVGPAALALAEGQRIPGNDFLTALILGIDVQCRLARSIFLPPAEREFGWYMTSVVGGIGAAATAASLLNLDTEQTAHALAIAAVRSGGFRQALSNMCVGYAPAAAARDGVSAALLARKGFTCSEQAFEGVNGFGQVFAHAANLPAATESLGTQWEILGNSYKPYPSGFVTHPAIDGCLAIAGEVGPDPDTIRRVVVRVSPMTQRLVDRPNPATSYEARVSVQYWAAAALLHRAAGLDQITDAAMTDSALAALRAKVESTAEDGIRDDEAYVSVELADGSVHSRHVEHCIGGPANPMTDEQLSDKFMAQVLPLLGTARAADLLERCWNLPDSGDAGEIARLSGLGVEAA